MTCVVENYTHMEKQVLAYYWTQGEMTCLIMGTARTAHHELGLTEPPSQKVGNGTTLS
jgi:hypothetical protein